jgi:hypothetical protein
VKKQFYKLDGGLVERYGLEEAALTGVLLSFSKVAEKDERGFFAVETAWLAKRLHFSKMKLLRVVQNAKTHHLIQYKPGKNQNEKPKFKIF